MLCKEEQRYETLNKLHEKNTEELLNIKLKSLNKKYEQFII